MFAEKHVSRIGVLLPFRREFERIMEGVDAPIMPACLGRVWGSVLSLQSGRFFWKVPQRLPYPVTFSFGHAHPRSDSDCRDTRPWHTRTAICLLWAGQHHGSRAADGKPWQIDSQARKPSKAKIGK